MRKYFKTKLRKMKSLFKRKLVRGSATTGLEASTRVPASGFAFVTNSQGASASIAEFSRVLDDILGEIEFEGKFWLLLPWHKISHGKLGANLLAPCQTIDNHMSSRLRTES